MPIADVLQVTCYNLTKYGDPGHFVCKYSGWGGSNCLYAAKIWPKIYSYSTILFVSCMEQLYIEELLIHWHTGLKFSSENRNPQIPEIGRKIRSIHPKTDILKQNTHTNGPVIWSYMLYGKMVLQSNDVANQRHDGRKGQGYSITETP